MANVLLGSLSHSGEIRGVIAERLDQPHLIEATDLVLRRHEGNARIWRTDRLATVRVHLLISAIQIPTRDRPFAVAPVESTTTNRFDVRTRNI